MKLLIAILFYFQTINTGKTDFYNEVLNSRGTHSYMVSIKVKSSAYDGNIIIKNSELFYYTKLTKKRYVKLVKKKILEDSPLELSNQLFNDNPFVKVVTIESVNMNSRKGVDEFINIYFDGNVMKNDILIKEQMAIIQKLFQWKVLCYRDDESGAFVIVR